jgi:branched-chain amino acid transport system ATP-binding protein
MLEISDVTTAYGAIEALRGVTLAAREGEVTCILGPNGAGKTTLLYSIAGILRPKRGSIRFAGREISGMGPERVVGLGLSLVPESRLVFPHMTARDNLLAGAYSRLRQGRDQVDADMDRMFARFPILKERALQRAGTLSGGEQQMLAVARALMARPRFLMMDEPSLGLAPLVVEEVFRVIAELHREGTTILLVEQNARMALEISDRAYLLEQGRITFHGTPRELGAEEAIRRAYLGTKR